MSSTPSSMPSGVSFARIGSGIYYKNTASRDWVYQVNETLIDMSTGDVYECKSHTWLYKNTKNYRLTTDWKYVRTDIIKPPTKPVMNLTLKRNSGYNFTISWKFREGATDSNTCDRTEKIWTTVELLDENGKVTHTKYDTLMGAVTSYSPLVFSTSNSSSSYLWKRSDFAPYTDKFVKQIRFTIQPANTRGAYATGTASSITYDFKKPKTPTHEEYKIDKSTGDISVEFNSPIDMNSEYDNAYNKLTVAVIDSRTGTKSSTYTKTESKFTFTQSVPDWQTLTYNDYIAVNFQLIAHGIRTSNAANTFTAWMSFPQKPEISIGAISEDWSSGSVIIKTKAHFINGPFFATDVKLQCLRSTSYQSAQEIPPTADWKDVGPTEKAETTAIALAIPDVLPDAGTVTWIRAKSWKTVEELYYRYSEPLRLTELETPAPVVPSADDDMADILGHVVNADGTSVELLIGWDEDEEDESNQTEVSWATSEKAWRSTKQPDTFMFSDTEWNEGAVTIGSKTYHKSTHITISELDANTRYYMSCRRVMDPDEGDTTYGPYSTKYIVNTNDVSALPQSVVAYTDESIIAGEPIQLSWSYNSPMEQSSWMIKKAVEGSDYSDDDIVLAYENDARHTFKLPYFRDRENTLPIADDGDSEICLYVVVTVSSVTLTSEIVKLRILKRPEFDIVAPPSTIVQPVSLAVFSDNKNTMVSAFIEASGVVGDGPRGKVTQSSGDIVWSGTINPQWELIDEYAEDVDVQQAKQDLDDAQEAYDEILGQYNDAVSRRDDASARIEALTVSISNAQRDIPTAQATLQDAENRLEDTDVDDPMYELYAAQVQEAEDRLQELQDGLQADTAALTVAEADLQTAIDDIDEIDMSDEEAALQDAIDAYATAEAEAIDPTSDTLAYKALIIPPSELNLVDRARYLVHGFATDTQHDVRSEERLTMMNVAWAHQAPTPPESIAIDSVDSTDDAGNRTLGTRITLESPVSSFESDVYDIYRITKGGIFPVIENAPIECVVFDRYAMFSNEPMRYRIACRTQDGDVTWRDYTYILQESGDMFRSAMRIDWAEGYIELERNVVPSDSYEKPFVSHVHLDGTVSGHWNEGIMRTMSVQAALVRSYDIGQREALEELARYDGPCYVRTNDGVAFECNVQVSSISLNRKSARIDVSFDMTEIESTGMFSATVEE